MSGFKLLAIRPMSGCDEKYCKNLEIGQFFTFYNNFRFSISEKNNVLFELLGNNTNNLYDVIRPDGRNLNINISAIVGKNGSGKSALFDLLYAVCFILAENEGLINEIVEFNKQKEQLTFNKNQIDLFQELLYVKNEVSVEIYFTDDKNVFCIVNDKNQMSYYSKLLDNGPQDIEWVNESDSFALSEFAYSIAINYSIYGLNSKSGAWLDSLFHKNDGYQTPLVINPYRDTGNIDVNTEYHLVQSRLLANLDLDSNFQVLSDKFLSGINFSFDPFDLFALDMYRTSMLFETYQKKYGKKVFELFTTLYEGITNEKFIRDDEYISSLEIELMNSDHQKYLFSSKNDAIAKYQDVEFLLIKYTIRKIFKLCIRDKDLRNSYLIFVSKGEFNIPSIQNADDLILEIIERPSHLTLKIRQIIFAIKNRFFNNKDIRIIEKPHEHDHIEKHFEYLISFSVEEYLVIYNNTLLDNSEVVSDPLDLVPNVFGKVDLFFKHGLHSSSESSFSRLSSGEQQLIITLQTLYYHLYNINSVQNPKIKYKNVNIILDEIELYFHPEYQRKFIKELLNGLSKIKIPDIESINILFSTHSPFILSDISVQNILKLIDGDPQPYNETEQTFGANIHDLLANDFFLKGSFMGDFAKQKINSLIDFLKSENKTDEKWNENNAFQFINIIGEDLIKNTLLEIYYEKFQDKLDTQIQHLMSLKKNQ